MFKNSYKILKNRKVAPRCRTGAGGQKKNMKDGFIKVAACSPKVVLADPKANADAIIAALHRAAAHGVRLAAFPELAMTGYTCGDLFMHELLLDSVVS